MHKVKKEVKKAKDVWVICATNSSCIVNAVCMSKTYAENWVKEQNRELGYEAYWIERGQLIF